MCSLDGPNYRCRFIAALLVLFLRNGVSDDAGAAYVQACRYPDGTNVLCATVLTLDAGQIRDQTVVQVWDEN